MPLTNILSTAKVEHAYDDFEVTNHVLVIKRVTVQSHTLYILYPCLAITVDKIFVSGLKVYFNVWS